jgi:predicted nucleotide-binding protein
VQAFVFDGIGEGIFYAWRDLEERVTAEYSTARDQALDVIETLSSRTVSKALSRYIARIEADLAPYTVADYVDSRIKTTPRMTRDSEEFAKGQVVPLHLQYLATVRSAEVTKKRANELAGVIRNVIEAASLRELAGSEPGMSVKLFIGHGRSDQWKMLRDFVRDRLHLEFDEFNRVPVAGISNKERLDEMLDQCGFALLVMTGEDEHDDGTLHARENVIHEIGLFQGRLGWRKAIVVIEDGCQEFSNIVGLGQVRYKKGDISSCFEEIRRILEREGLIAAASANSAA